MTPTPRNHYEVLGVPRTATSLELRRAYRRLALRYHPDVSVAPDAAARFDELSSAYEVLQDPERRARYDRTIAVTRRPFPPAARRAWDVPRFIDDENDLAAARSASLQARVVVMWDFPRPPRVEFALGERRWPLKPWWWR